MRYGVAGYAGWALRCAAAIRSLDKALEEMLAGDIAEES